VNHGGQEYQEFAVMDANGNSSPADFVIFQQLLVLRSEFTKTSHFMRKKSFFSAETANRPSRSPPLVEAVLLLPQASLLDPSFVIRNSSQTIAYEVDVQW